VRYVWTPNLRGGFCDHELQLIEYNTPQTLAHELAHAIEMKLFGFTTEYGAWKLAHSFLKPKYWSDEVAKYAYGSHVRFGNHTRVLRQVRSNLYQWGYVDADLMPRRLDFLKEDKEKCSNTTSPGVKQREKQNSENLSVAFQLSLPDAL